MDEMLTMDPPPLAVMAGMAYLQQRNTPFRLVSMVRSQSTSSTSTRGGGRIKMAAPLTKMSNRPNRVTASVTIRSTWKASEMFTPTTAGVSGVAFIRDSVSSAPAMFRSAITTLAPSRPNLWQIARPIPEAPPVTMATLFSSLPVKSVLLMESCRLAPIVAHSPASGPCLNTHHRL